MHQTIAGVRMPGCLSESEIAAAAAGTTPEQDRQRVQEHLQQCAICRVRVEFRQQNSSVADFNSGVQPSSERSASESGVSRASAPWESTLPSIEGYELLSEVHRGAQGIVYKAVQKSTHRTVAIKVLVHEGIASDRQKQRFEREVSLAASLRHPNIVTIYDSGLTSGQYYFAMEYIHGATLDAYIAAANLTVPDKLKLFAVICSAVAHAHRQGIVHRDLKPANILVDSRGEPHIVDFGLAKPAGLSRPAEPIPLTLTSQFMGTLAYASPEQTKGDPSLIDARSDVYGLGVILYEMMTGQFPYPLSGDFVKMFQTICTTAPVKPSSITKHLNADIDTIVLRALAKEPERRYQSVAEFGRDIERSLAGEPIWARRDSLAYVLCVRGTRVLQRHRVLTALGIIALSIAVVRYGGAEALKRWRWPSSVFEKAFTGLLAPPADPSTFKDVRIIAITDHTVDEIDSLAHEEQLEGVSAADRITWRRLHGRLMDRLADAGVRTVVLDLYFPDKSDTVDRDFVDGIKKVQSKPDGGVVIGTSPWGLFNGKPLMSSEIYDANPLWGGVTINTGSIAAWRMDLIYQHGHQSSILSIDVQALSAWYRPGQQPSPVLDRQDQTIQLQYAAGAALGESVRLSTIQTSKGEPEEIATGISAGDVLGQYVINLPSDDVLNSVTFEYQDVLRGLRPESSKPLGKEFAGKLVVVGYFLPEEDVYQAPDGRHIHGTAAHAAVIDQLLREAAIRYASGYWYSAMVAVGAGLGVAAIWLSKGNRRRRALFLLASAGIVIAMSVVAFRYYNVLCNPLLPGAALLLAAIVFAIVDQARRLPDDRRLNRRVEA